MSEWWALVSQECILLNLWPLHQPFWVIIDLKYLLGNINLFCICEFPGGKLRWMTPVNTAMVWGALIHHIGAGIYLLHLLSLTMIPHQMCEVGCYARLVLKTLPLGGRWVLLGIYFEVLRFHEMWEMAILKHFSLGNHLYSSNKTCKES